MSVLLEKEINDVLSQYGFGTDLQASCGRDSFVVQSLLLATPPDLSRISLIGEGHVVNCDLVEGQVSV